jgi:ribose transport system permease protein
VRSFTAAYGTAMAGLVVFVLLLVFAQNFATPANLLNVLKQTSFLAILAVGFTYALIAAELDLSFAALASLAAVAVGGLLHGGVAWPLAALVGLAIGLGGGVLNGVLVTVVKVPSLIATLGTASVVTGLAFMATDGVSFVGRWDADFLWIARGEIGGIPNLALLMLAIVTVAWFASRRTRFGLHLQMTGEAADAARRAGIPTRRLKAMGLVVSGAAAGLCAVLLVSSLSSAAPQMAGDFLLKAIAAALLGMTMIDPGKPNVAGTFLGALIIATLANGLVLLGAPYYWQDIVLGLIVVGSVAVSAAALRQAAFSL